MSNDEENVSFKEFKHLKKMLEKNCKYGQKREKSGK